MDVRKIVQKNTVRYNNLPQRFDLDDYQNATSKFVKKYSSHPDVLSIYLFGNVSVVGISDLDFIVVFKDRLTAPLAAHYSVSHFEKNLCYLYNDTQPFLMNRNGFQNFWKIFPATGLRLVYGKDIDLATTNAFEKNVYDALILVDICNYWYPLLFLRLLFSPTLNVRYSLNILNALGFPLQICQRLIGREIGLWGKFIKKITKLRKQWFELEEFEKYQELHMLLEEASKVSLDLIRRLDDYINENLWTLSLNYNSSELKEIGRFELCRYIFLSSFNPQKMQDTILNIYKKTGKFVSLLPAAFYFPLSQYCQEKGMISQHISRHLSGERDCFVLKNSEIKEIIKSRIELMSAHASFYKDSDIQINMVHNYYGYNPVIPEKGRGFLSGKGRAWGKLQRIKNNLYWDAALMSSGISIDRVKKIMRIFKSVP